jgi:hypothetical protein
VISPDEDAAVGVDVIVVSSTGPLVAVAGVVVRFGTPVTGRVTVISVGGGVSVGVAVSVVVVAVKVG